LGAPTAVPPVWTAYPVDVPEPPKLGLSCENAMCAHPELSVSTPKSSNRFRPDVHVAPLSHTVPWWTAISCCGVAQDPAVFWAKYTDHVWLLVVGAP
jgi:hypothetical protein